MTQQGFFVRQETTDHEIAVPGRDRQLKACRARLEQEKRPEGEIKKELDALSATLTATVKLRPLNAGEMAKINEIRVDAGGGTIPIGEGRLLAVELALVEWSLDQPITRDTIRQLNPVVFQRIYDLVDVGGEPDDPPRRESEPAPALLAPAPDLEEERERAATG